MAEAPTRRDRASPGIQNLTLETQGTEEEQGMKLSYLPCVIPYRTICPDFQKARDDPL
jgi:hypothetical protein